MSIIAPYDRLALQERFRNAEPFRFFVVDDLLRREFADVLAASFPSYENVLPAQGLFRRLNILIYLNPEWDARWAGQLELWDRDVQRCLHSVAPIHNRCVVFGTTDFSFHGVAAVRCPPGFARKSFAAYYYTREAPRDSVGERRETLFVARPNEYMKRHVLMPAVTARRSLA